MYFRKKASEIRKGWVVTDRVLGDPVTVCEVITQENGRITLEVQPQTTSDDRVMWTDIESDALLRVMVTWNGTHSG